MEGQSFFLSLISGGKQGFLGDGLRGFLRFLAGIYWLVVQARIVLYRVGFFKTYSLPRPVISIGNITTGGTGKTPAVIMLARQLQQQGKKVVVLSRGYKKQLSVIGHRLSVKVVADGQKILLSPEKAGDEPYLMARELGGVPVIVSKDRVKSGKVALSKFAVDLILLDDGFQYLRLRRDLNIVLIDAALPWGYNGLLPRGLLREPKSNLRRADIFLLTKVNMVLEEQIKIIIDELKSINPRAGIVRSIYQPQCIEKFPERRRESLDWLRHRQIIALSGIAHPDSFEKSLKNLGAKIVQAYRFPDHYSYAEKDLEEALSLNYPVITTAKDAVRLPFSSSCWVLKIEIKIVSGEKIWEERLMRLIG